MGRINQVPRGLQFLLGNTNFGDNPSELNDITGPTLEQFPFLGQTLLDFRKENATINSRGDLISIEVPEGEMWMPLAMSWLVPGVNEVGTQISVRLELRDINRQTLNASSIHNVSMSAVRTSIQVGEFLGDDFQFNDRFLVPSGVVFSARIGLYIPGVGVILNDGVDIYVQAYRFKV